MELTISHIKECDAYYYNLDTNGEDDMDYDDPRFDICLYFMPPSGEFDRDIRNIKRLETLLPVYPVIAKAETL